MMKPSAGAEWGDIAASDFDARFALPPIYLLPSSSLRSDLVGGAPSCPKKTKSGSGLPDPVSLLKRVVEAAGNTLLTAYSNFGVHSCPRPATLDTKPPPSNPPE